MLFSKVFGFVTAALCSVAVAAPTPSANRVVVDPIGVYMRVTSLKDGSLFGTYTVVSGDQQIIKAVKSTDKGNSWQQVGTVTSGTASKFDIDNSFPLQLPGGRILVAFRNHDRSTTGTPKFSWYRITLCYSDDNGATWHYLTQIDEHAANGYNGLWEPFLRLARDGSLQVYYSSENNLPDQDNVMKISRDNGQTWGAMRPVSGQGVTTRDGMMGIAPIDNNGNLICVFENTELGRFSIDSVVSQDDGLTWNTRRRVYTAANGKEAGAPQVINVGGTLVTDFMTNEAGTSGQVDGGEMKIVTSTDRGSSWSASTVVGGSGSHWPGMFSVDSTHFLALYSINGAGLVSQMYKL